MKKTLSASLLALIAFTSLPAMAQITLTDFESYTTPTAEGAVLLRQPSYSGSTSSKLDTTVLNTSVVLSDGLPAGNPNSGNNALHMGFDFKDTGVTPLWVRLTTFGGTILPNPTVGLFQGWSLQFDIYSDTPLYVTTLIRETESNAALGANGGSTGTIEYVGGNPTAASGRGKAVAANTWTTLVFNFDTEPVFAFTGNGVLDRGADGKGVLEAIGIAVDPTSINPINVWIDNIQMVPEPSALALGLLGGFFLLFRRFRR
jgi:hypothetical protein